MEKTLIIITVMIICGMFSCTSKKNTVQQKQNSSSQVEKSENVLSNENSGIKNKYWKLIELNGTKVEYVEGMRDAYIIFKDDSTVNGCLGCNKFHGRFEMDKNNRLKISELIATKMMCLGEGMTLEEEMNRILSIADNFFINEDGFLSLNKARMATLAKFEAVVME